MVSLIETMELRVKEEELPLKDTMTKDGTKQGEGTKDTPQGDQKKRIECDLEESWWRILSQLGHNPKIDWDSPRSPVLVSKKVSP